MRTYRVFRYRDASYRIGIPPLPAKLSETLFNSVCSRIKALRTEIEEYIAGDPSFLSSLVPVVVKEDAPETVRKMAEISKLTGLGPMAGIAGCMAQYSALRAVQVFNEECGGEAPAGLVIENGGDVFITESASGDVFNIGLFPGPASPLQGLALRLDGKSTPVSVCSSSSYMGHSLSFGKCDLSTVIAADAVLADSAATLGANLVKTEEDLQAAAETIMGIPGIRAVLLIKNKKMSIAGELPDIIRNNDPKTYNKITVTE